MDEAYQPILDIGTRSDESRLGRHNPVQHGMQPYHKESMMFANALLIMAESAGRTSRSSSFPSFKKTRVGQSFTPKERPNRRPLPSSILMCRMGGYSERAAAISG